MIQEFVDRFIAAQPATFTEKHPGGYEVLVREVVRAINPDDGYDLPDPNRVHVIDDGDYQGTLVFVIGATGYQPCDYWATTVSYGSCSGCDTLQSIHPWDLDERPTEQQAKDYQTLALHIVQRMAKI